MKNIVARLSSKRVCAARMNSQAGFTLLEIIIVLGIIGTLMAVLVGGLGQSSSKAKNKETGVKAANIQAKLLQYSSDVNNFPSTADGLQALLTQPASGTSKWGGPYFTAEDDIKDAWSNPFEYEMTSKGPKLVSAGADGQTGTSDDLTFINGREAENAAPAEGGAEGGQANP